MLLGWIKVGLHWPGVDFDLTTQPILLMKVTLGTIIRFLHLTIGVDYISSRWMNGVYCHIL